MSPKAKLRLSRPLTLSLLAAGVGTFIFLVAIPLGLLVIGVLLVNASINSEASANAYRAAQQCPGAVRTTNCFTFESGTVTRAEVTHGKAGDTTDLDIHLQDRTVSTWVATSAAAEDALRVGVPVTVKLYRDKITVVSVPGFQLTARDNPIRVQQDERLGGFLFIAMGIGLGSILPIGWLRKQKRPAGYIDPNLLVAMPEEELSRVLAERFGLVNPTSMVPQSTSIVLPYTVRPQPAPSGGRPWWLAPIVTAVAFPLMALRLRAPFLVSIVTVVASLSAAAIGVVLHWLYIRNRRLVVDDLSVFRIDLWGRRRSVVRSEVRRIAFPTLSSWATGQHFEPRVLLLANDGRCLLALPRYNVTPSEASELAAVLRVPMDSETMRMLSRKQMAQQFPGSLTWVERHVVLVNLVLAPAVLAVMVLFVWAANGFK